MIYAVLLRLNCCHSFSRCRAIAVEERKKKKKKKKKKKIDDLARFSDCRSGTLAMLSSKLTVLLPMEVRDNG